MGVCWAQSKQKQQQQLLWSYQLNGLLRCHLMIRWLNNHVSQLGIRRAACSRSCVCSLDLSSILLAQLAVVRIIKVMFKICWMTELPQWRGIFSNNITVMHLGCQTVSQFKVFIIKQRCPDDDTNGWFSLLYKTATWWWKSFNEFFDFFGFFWRRISPHTALMSNQANNLIVNLSIETSSSLY